MQWHPFAGGQAEKAPPPLADPPIEKLEDLYSYSLEMLIYPDSAGAAAFLTAKVVAMAAVQVLLAFGFYDASILLIFQGNTNLLGGSSTCYVLHVDVQHA